MSSARKHAILKQRSRPVRELIDALFIAHHYEPKDLHKAQMLALCIVDWAHRESRRHSPSRLKEDAQAALGQ